MLFIILLFVFFVGGGWLIGKLIANWLFPKSDDTYFPETNSKEKRTTIINNYTTENHLHISKEDFKGLIE